MPDFDLGFVERLVAESDIPSNYEVFPWQEDEIVLVLTANHPVVIQHPDSVLFRCLYTTSGNMARSTVWCKASS